MGVPALFYSWCLPKIFFVLIIFSMTYKEAFSTECYVCSWNPKDHQLEDDRCSIENFDPARTRTITCVDGCEIVHVRDNNGVLEMFYRNCMATKAEITNSFKKRNSAIVQEEVLTCNWNYCNDSIMIKSNVAGSIIAGYNIWLLVYPSYIVIQDSYNEYMLGFCVLLFVGVLLAIVGFLGGCGACRESQCLLVSFFCVLLIVVVAQIAALVWGYTTSDQLHELIKDNMEKTVREDYGQNGEDGQPDMLTNAFDTIQREFKCCGANGPTDWNLSKYGGARGENKHIQLTIQASAQTYKIPASCCDTADSVDALCTNAQNAVVGGDVSEHIFHKGCIEGLYEKFATYKGVFLGVVITVALLEIFGLVFSIILCCAVRFVDRYKA